MKTLVSVILAVLLPQFAWAQQEKNSDLAWSPSASVYPQYLLSNGFIADYRAVWNVGNTITYKPLEVSFTYQESFGSHPGYGNEKDYTVEKAAHFKGLS